MKFDWDISLAYERDSARLLRYGFWRLEVYTMGRRASDELSYRMAHMNLLHCRERRSGRMSLKAREFSRRRA